MTDIKIAISINKIWIKIFYCQDFRKKNLSINVLSAGEKEEGNGTTDTGVSLRIDSKNTVHKGDSVEYKERVSLPDSKEDSTYLTSRNPYIVRIERYGL